MDGGSEERLEGGGTRTSGLDSVQVIGAQCVISVRLDFKDYVFILTSYWKCIQVGSAVNKVMKINVNEKITKSWPFF